MLLLHGALGSASQFDALSADLTPTVAVHRFDFVAHGASALPATLTMATLADQVADFVESHDLRGQPCFGYSMGGYVALMVASSRRGLLGPITTLATKFAWTPEVAAREVAQLDPDALLAKVPKFAAALEARHTGAGWRELCRATAGMLRDLGERPPLDAATLGRIDVPVKIMVGDRDSMVTLEESIATYRALPNAQLAVLPGVAHPYERVPIPMLVRELLPSA